MQTRSFNPHRLLGVGATPFRRLDPRRLGVSILTDSWESVQHCSKGSLLSPTLFQSSPTPGSRCNVYRLRRRPFGHCVSILTDSWESVQRSAGWESSGSGARFNPHRLLGVGATGLQVGTVRRCCAVSILTDSWESVQLRSVKAQRKKSGVSILTDSWESVQPMGAEVCFRS